MMTKKSLMLMSMLLLLLASCDKNKGKVENLTNQFIEAVNGNDKATVYDMFPDIKTLEKLSIPDSIPAGEVTVSKDDKSGNYIASINNSRSQKILFKPEGEETFKIQDTYCIFELDSANKELALKTGVPMKQITDKALNNLFIDDSEYLKFLFEKYSDVVNGNLISESGTYAWSGGWNPAVTVTQPIRNIGNVPISWNEYTVEFYFYTPSGAAASSKMVEQGVDLQPGEAYTYTLYTPGYYRAAIDHDFTWTVTFTYKNRSPLDALLQYAKFSGKEYDEFKAANPDSGKSSSKEKATSDKVTKVQVTGVNVRLRKSPEMSDGNIIKKADGTNLHPNKGDVLECLGESGDFYRVKYKGEEAYISKKFATPQ